MATQPSGGPPQGCRRERVRLTEAPRLPAAAAPGGQEALRGGSGPGEPRLQPVTRRLRSLYLVPQAGGRG